MRPCAALRSTGATVPVPVPRVVQRFRKTYSKRPPSAGAVEQLFPPIKRPEAPVVDRASKTVRTPGGQLPISPLMDQDFLDARSRWKEPKPRPSTSVYKKTRFRKQLEANPYAQALGTPTRLCPITNVHLPRFFLQGFELVGHPETGAPWWVPCDLTAETKDSDTRHSEGNRGVGSPELVSTVAPNTADTTTRPSETRIPAAEQEEIAPSATTHPTTKVSDTEFEEALNNATPVKEEISAQLPAAGDSAGQTSTSPSNDTPQAPLSFEQDLELATQQNYYSTPSNDTQPPKRDTSTTKQTYQVAAPATTTPDSARTPPGPSKGYVLARSDLLRAFADTKQRSKFIGAHRRILARTSSPRRAQGERAVWREDMADLVASLLRERVAAALLRLARRGELRTADGLDAVRRLGAVGCVVYVGSGDEPLAEPAGPGNAMVGRGLEALRLAKGRDRLDSVVKIYRLEEMLGKERAARLREEAEVFGGDGAPLLALSGKGAVEVQMLMWKLEGYLARPAGDGASAVADGSR